MLVLLPASASLASSAPSAARDLRDLDSCESDLALRVPPPQPEAASSSIPAVAIAVTESLVADTAESLCPVGRLENAKNRQPPEASRRGGRWGCLSRCVPPRESGAVGSNCVRCSHDATADGFRAHRRRRRSVASSDAAVRSRSGAAYIDGCRAHLAGLVADRAGRHRRGARCRSVRSPAAGRRPVALHSARLWLRVSRGRTLDCRRTPPAGVGACAANWWPRIAGVPHRRAVHRRRSRACRYDRRARDRSDLTLCHPELVWPPEGAWPVLDFKRRGWDLNPRATFRPPAVFKTAPFDRSGTPPVE